MIVKVYVEVQLIILILINLFKRLIKSVKRERK